MDRWLHTAIKAFGILWIMSMTGNIWVGFGIVGQPLGKKGFHKQDGSGIKSRTGIRRKNGGHYGAVRSIVFL